MKGGNDGGGGGGGRTRTKQKEEVERRRLEERAAVGDPSDRPKVTLMPSDVPSHKKPDKGLVEKELIYTDKSKPRGEGAPSQVPLQDVLPQFQRAAEDAIERELIPPAYRDHVRRYYDFERK